MTSTRFPLLGAMAIALAGCSSSTDPRVGWSTPEDRYDPAYQMTMETVPGRVDCAGGTVVHGVLSGDAHQKIDVWACEQGKAVHREYWFVDGVLQGVTERVAGKYFQNQAVTEVEGLTMTRLERFIRNDEGEFITAGGEGATASAEKKQMLLEAANTYIEQFRRATPSGTSASQEQT